MFRSSGWDGWIGGGWTGLNVDNVANVKLNVDSRTNVDNVDNVDIVDSDNVTSGAEV